MGKDKVNATPSSNIWNDSRFSHLVTDPRFKKLPQSKRKVKIDKRFQSMFHDDKFRVDYATDKYGRRLNKTSTDDLKKYYDLNSSSDEEENCHQKKNEKKPLIGGKDNDSEDDHLEHNTSSDEEDEKKQTLAEEKQITQNDSIVAQDDLNDPLEEPKDQLPGEIIKKLRESGVDYARGEGQLLTDSSSDEESSSEDGEEELYLEHVWGELDNDAPMTEESTRRLASCNMDWDRIRATDVMVLCNSFLPPGGSILSVKIYPSDFGKERMKEEELHGPPELTKVNEDDNDESLLVKEEDSDLEEGSEYHMEKLRQYQLNRLKYYYAVIECDCVRTADKLYKECDGLEYESTSNKLDLRFIPDDTSFDGDEPTDICEELPDLNKYKPRMFTTTALQQAKVELTWDETHVERKEFSDKLRSGKVTEITDADINKYVAYSSEEDNDHSDASVSKNESNDTGSNEEVTKKKGSISIYKSLLEELNKKESEKKKSKLEMEYLWSINVPEKKKDTPDIKTQLTPIEKALEKKKIKNKRRKEERKKKYKENEDEYSSDDVPDGIDMNDPYFAEEFANGDFEERKKSKSKNKRDKHDGKTETEDTINANELELLLDDCEDDKEHFNLKKIQDAESETKSKKRRNKLKKSKKHIEANKNKIDDNFEINLNDDRFTKIYTSPLFNIDPTDPHFKKTKAMEAIIQEKLKRKQKSTEKSLNIVEDEIHISKRPKKYVENSILVKNLKRKIQANKSKN